ncbi:hypothetical protein pb186bvf_017133 [Paramecium bursaria]
MDYKQIVDILENQPYLPVVVKTFDNNNVSLSILRVNEDRKVYTDTPQFQWQTYQFTKQYRLQKIQGKLYSNDNRFYDYECQQIMDIFNKQQGVHKDLSIEFKTKLWALGIRFQGINTKNDIFHLNKLNIFAEVGMPEAQEGVQQKLIHLDYDKRQIINLLERQLVYTKINNHYLASKQYVIKKIDQSQCSIQDIVDNKDSYINLYSSDWITFEFARKFKLKSVKAMAFDGKTIYYYEFQILNKQKQWVKIQQNSSLPYLHQELEQKEVKKSILEQALEESPYWQKEDHQYQNNEIILNRINFEKGFSSLVKLKKQICFQGNLKQKSDYFGGNNEKEKQKLIEQYQLKKQGMKNPFHIKLSQAFKC